MPEKYYPLLSPFLVYQNLLKNNVITYFSKILDRVSLYSFFFLKKLSYKIIFFCELKRDKIFKLIAYFWEIWPLFSACISS